jgi:hypothetical protein
MQLLCPEIITEFYQDTHYGNYIVDKLDSESTVLVYGRMHS